MSHSPSIVNLSKALFRFQANVTKIKKDASNPFFKSKYASLSHILDEIDSHLIEAGILIMQHPVNSDNVDLISLSTMVVHAETGEFMESVFSMSPAKKDPQGVGSCISYMRRYALTSILKLNVDDDDGNEASTLKKVLQTSQIEKSRKERDMALFSGLVDKIGLCQSPAELAGMVGSIQASDLSDNDRNHLRNLYKRKLDSFREVSE